MWFELVGEIENVETTARGRGIRALPRLRKHYGSGLWLKRKGYARIRDANGHLYLAEVDRYEASGIGKKEMKIKDIIDEA